MFEQLIVFGVNYERLTDDDGGDETIGEASIACNGDG